ncbi:hypothetical protein P7C73_g6237, partial [Tremellales sp. Uapishka_1]
MDTSGSTPDAHAVMDPFDIEIRESWFLLATVIPSQHAPSPVFKVLSNTIFSPYFLFFLPLTFYSQVKSTSHPAFVASVVWSGLVFLYRKRVVALDRGNSSLSKNIDALAHIDRVYANQLSWFFAPPPLNWEDQIVLITGGGSGVGALLAETLAMRHVTVVVLTNVQPRFENDNGNINTYICDVSKYAEVQAVADKVRGEVGDPTIIVNNAGIVSGKLLLDLEEADIVNTFNTNTLAHFWILKTYLPAMLRRGTGHVVNIASIMGVIGAAQMTDYAASKAALVSLHQSLRYELDNRYKTPSIRTTLLLPSHILTKLFASLRLPTSRFFRFLAPPLQPHVVVKAIISALDAQESRVIRLPFYTEVGRLLGVGVGILPTYVTDAIQWFAGADWAMREYGPKPDAAQRLLQEMKHAD